MPIKTLGLTKENLGRKTTTYRLFGHHFVAHSHLVIKVAEAAVALCCSVELCDLWDIEALHELLPYGLPQAVAHCHAHPMLFLHVPNRLVQQVSTDLTNVLHNLEESGAGR